MERCRSCTLDCRRPINVLLSCLLSLVFIRQKHNPPHIYGLSLACVSNNLNLIALIKYTVSYELEIKKKMINK